MLGRLRPFSSSSSSLDSLDRPASKIVKHDSLSIYEATVLKLKLASRHDISSLQDEPMTTGTDASCTSVPESSQNESSSPSMEAVEMETSKQTNCSSVGSSKGYKLSQNSSNYEEEMALDATGISRGCDYHHQPVVNLGKQQGSKNLSIADLFSRYKSSQHAQSSECEETM